MASSDGQEIWENGYQTGHGNIPACFTRFVPRHIRKSDPSLLRNTHGTIA